MPRFYFDVREGACIIPDEEGSELDSLDAAEYEAAELRQRSSGSTCRRVIPVTLRLR